MVMSSLAGKYSVAISSDFLAAFAAVPRQEQGKVVDFVTKFRNNPASAGINYEKIYSAYDSKFRSVRIDESYRGIVLKPDEGNVYLLLWVDRHEQRIMLTSPSNQVLRIPFGPGVSPDAEDGD
jgi:hypothetical protein